MVLWSFSSVGTKAAKVGTVGGWASVFGVVVKKSGLRGKPRDGVVLAVASGFAVGAGADVSAAVGSGSVRRVALGSGATFCGVNGSVGVGADVVGSASARTGGSDATGAGAGVSAGLEPRAGSAVAGSSTMGGFGGGAKSGRLSGAGARKSAAGAAGAASVAAKIATASTRSCRGRKYRRGGNAVGWERMVFKNGCEVFSQTARLDDDVPAVGGVRPRARGAWWSGRWS